MSLKILVRLLDRAIEVVPAARFYWGVIAAGATVAIINLIIGLNRVTFISMVMAFVAAILFFIFSQLQKSSTAIVKWAGQIIILVIVLAFALFVVTSFTLALTCWPQLFAYLYGVDTICQRTAKSEFDRIIDDRQYGRLFEITGGGTPKFPCKADPNASAVQIFEHGWLLARFTESVFYAIMRADDDELIRWTKHPDIPGAKRATCTGIDNEQLLQFGFRNWYCDPSSERIRTELGRPKTVELPVWVQFQEWPHGLLAHGLPGTDEELERGAFNWLAAVFLTNESTVMNGTGRSVSFPFNAANTKENVYCTSLWYPARRGPGGYIIQDLPLPLESRQKCSRKIGPKTYVEGHRACLIFGYDYRDE